MEDGDDLRIRELLLRQYNLRIDPEMGRFVLARLNDGAGDAIPVMGGDARTGVAVRQVLAAGELRAALDSPTFKSA